MIISKKRTITKKQLHKIIEKYVPSFEDADLWSDTFITLCGDFEQQIIDTYENGYISIDSPDGQEIYYTNL